MRDMLRTTAHFLLIFLPFSLVFSAPGGEGSAPRPQRIVSGNPLGGAFYENRGQLVDTDKRQVPDIRYYAFFNGARVYFTPTGWSTVYGVSGPEALPISEATGKPGRNDGDPTDNPFAKDRDSEQTRRLHRMDMSFVGCNRDVEIEAAEPRPQYLNYYLPHCANGITKVPGFGGLRYKNLYNNIDLVLHVSKHGLKYEFEVRPGGRVADIRLRHDGTDGIADAGDGSLHIRWPMGYTHEGAPFSFQDGANGLEEIASSYSVDGTEVRFDVEHYDAMRTLIIDPWSTYYGGSNPETLKDITCDSSNAVIITGTTQSDDFPLRAAWQSTFNQDMTICIVKFDSTGGLLWATYYGGSAQDSAGAISTDPDRNILIAGHTTSNDFPVLGAFQSQRAGLADGVIVKLDSNGMRLWATFFGGTSQDIFTGIGTDGAGNIFATGYSSLIWGVSGFPLKRAYQPIPGGSNDPFIMKMDRDGDLIFSSYFGGPGTERHGTIGVDASGSFAICGTTEHTGFPTLNAWQPIHGGGGTKAYLAMFDSSGVPQWSTYIGGNRDDRGYDACFDQDGNVLLSGATRSPNFPVQWADQFPGDGFDAFIAKFNRPGALVWSSRVGGPFNDASDGAFGYTNQSFVSAGGAGSVYLSGRTGARGFPVFNAQYPIQPDTVSRGDGFVMKYDSAGAAKWSTFLGGNSEDVIRASACDNRGYLYVAGITNSINFPLFNAVQDTIAGVRGGNGEYPLDMFITRVRFDGFIPVTLSRLSALRMQGGVKLLWRTESEVNVYGFIIERRDETNTSWKDVGFVPSAAQGNEGRDYSLLDLDPGTTDTRLFYRLRMVDLDGTFEHSPIVEVGPESGALAVSFEAAYPSPARDWLTLNFTLPVEQPVTLSILDITGREIARIHDKQLLSAGTHSIALPVAEWRSGVYLCTLTVDGRRMVRRTLVVK